MWDIHLIMLKRGTESYIPMKPCFSLHHTKNSEKKIKNAYLKVWNYSCLYQFYLPMWNKIQKTRFFFLPWTFYILLRNKIQKRINFTSLSEKVFLSSGHSLPMCFCTRSEILFSGICFIGIHEVDIYLHTHMYA